MSEGYIYCLSNKSTPGILKIGMTERTPEERAKELFTTGVASPFTIEFAKKVKDPKHKEAVLHKLLEQYTERYNSRREFFRVSPEEVRKFFELPDGEWWVQTCDEEAEEESEESSSESAQQVKLLAVKGCRDMTKCFINGQRIRHTIGITKTWIGVYDSVKKGIVYDGQIFTLNKFAVQHLKLERPDRDPSLNAWKECECELDGRWISTYNLLDQSIGCI